MYGDHRDLHVLTHSFPNRRSSDLVSASMARPLLPHGATFRGRPWTLNVFGNYTLGIRKPAYFVIATPAKAGGSNPERFARTLDCFDPLAITGIRMRTGKTPNTLRVTREDERGGGQKGICRVRF